MTDWRKAMKFSEYTHYTIYQLAEFANVTPDQFIDVLIDCSYIASSENGYDIWDAGADLGGVYCDLPNDEFGLMFLGSILENDGVKDGLALLMQRKEKRQTTIQNLLEQRNEVNQIK